MAPICGVLTMISGTEAIIETGAKLLTGSYFVCGVMAGP